MSFHYNMAPSLKEQLGELDLFVYSMPVWRHFGSVKNCIKKSITACKIITTLVFNGPVCGILRKLGT